MIMRNWTGGVFILLIGISCSPVSRSSLNKALSDTEDLFQDNTGFMVYDPVSHHTIYEYHASTYFTPASNTKIFTLFAGLSVLGDSVPALRYTSRGDSLIFWGTGDPSLLNKNVYQNDRVLDLLSSTNQDLFFSDANFGTTHFGPGWAWDDYNDAYSAERSPLPVYGNVFTIEGHQQKVDIQPPAMRRYMIIDAAKDEPGVKRTLVDNYFTYYPGNTQGKFDKDIPMKVSSSLVRLLLSDTLKKEVHPIQKPMPRDTRVLFSIPADSLYKVMMQESDNFIAEQILLMCAGVLSDTLKPEVTIKFITEGPLKDLKDKPVWVDGSGLSRYNLFTPRSIVQLWEKIYHMVPPEKLFPLLATGGTSGTIRHWYGGEKPFLYGKTGTLSNNHCLSGFLVTRSGKTLIFSFMNSNFTVPTNQIRGNMQSILKLIYEKY